MSKSKTSAMLELKIGKKPVRPYVTAVIVHLKTGGTDIVIKARGQNVSKAVDVAEIVKRFQETPMILKDIKIGTEEFLQPHGSPNPEGEQRPAFKRRVSFIEIALRRVEETTAKQRKMEHGIKVSK